MLRRRWFRIAAVLAVAALGLALPSGYVLAAVRAHPAISSSVVKIGMGGTCLDVEFVFFDCGQGDSYQKWTEVAATGGTYKFENSYYYWGGPTCLSVVVTGPGVYALGLSQCAQGNGSQRFTLLSSTGGTYKIEQDAGGTTVCLTYSSSGPKGFTPCGAGDSAQRWDITPSP